MRSQFDRPDYHAERRAYRKYLQELENCIEDTRPELPEIPELPATDVIYTEKDNTYSTLVKGVLCKSGRTIRPAKQYAKRCECCRTHWCKSTIPIRGRKIKVSDFI